MPRNLSNNSLISLASQETDEAYISLVHVKKNDGTTIARFSNDSVDTVVGADTFLAFPFDVAFPDNQEGKETRASIMITNVDRTLIESLREGQGHLFVDLWLVLGSDPTDIMVHYPDLELRTVNYNTMVVSGELTYESFLSEAYPKDLMTGRHFPGLFIA